MTTNNKRSFKGLFIICLVLVGIVVFGQHYRLSFNTSDSLPFSVFFTNYDTPSPAKGQFVRAVLPKDHIFAPGREITKRVLGGPGDIITVKDRVVFINGDKVGIAKTFAKTLHHKEAPASDVPATPAKLSPIEPGVIPAKHWYLAGSHPDSYDSRYQSNGVFHEKSIIARAYPLF